MSRANHKNPRLLQAGGIGTFLLGIIFTLFFLFYFFGSGGAKVTSQRSVQGDISVLVNTPPSPLKPDGELAEIFTYGSDHTDLQRQLKLKEILGKIVEWELPVYEVKQSGSGYVIQTSNGGFFEKKLVGTFIHITPQDENDRGLVESLKTGSLVTFKGIIEDTTMRNLDIKPAILVKGSSLNIKHAILDDTEAATHATLQTANSPEKTELDQLVPNNNELVMNMLTARKNNNTQQILSLQAEIDALPKSNRGDRKLAREKNKLGLAAFQSGNFAKAIILFQEGANADPGDIELFNNQGYALMMNGQLDEAKSKLIEAIAMKASRGAAWENLGQVFAKQGDKDSAVACFQITYIFSRAPEKTVVYFTNLAASDPDAAVKAAAHEAVDSFAGIATDAELKGPH
jgi:hypothetical protein